MGAAGGGEGMAFGSHWEALVKRANPESRDSPDAQLAHLRSGPSDQPGMTSK
jgi:hypothetical protein